MTMSLPPKLAGGNVLDCGHQQVLGEDRLRLASQGMEQHPVWCIDCGDWARIAPWVSIELSEEKTEEE